MKWWRYLKSFFSSQLVQAAASPLNPTLQVALEFGRLRLNGAKANYSFGSLQQVFEETFVETGLRNSRYQQALLLGLGAASVAHTLQSLQPGLPMLGIELDPVVLQLAGEYFKLASLTTLQVVHADATQWVASSSQQFDLIIVDLFLDDQVPAAAQTDVFYAQLAARLAGNGRLYVNRLIHTASARAQTADAWQRFVAVFPNANVYRLPFNEVWWVLNDE